MKLVLNTTMNKLNPFAELICFIFDSVIR